MAVRHARVCSMTTGVRPAAIPESRSNAKRPINLAAKQTGKPTAGNPHGGFDVAGTGNGFTVRLVRHSQRKRGATDRLNLRSTAPVLDPTDPDVPGGDAGIHQWRVAQWGSAYGTQIARHLKNVFAALPPHVKTIHARADSGFYCWNAVEAYENHGVQFMISAQKTSRLVDELQGGGLDSARRVPMLTDNASFATSRRAGGKPIDSSPYAM